VKVVGAVALAALVLAGASASAAERAFPGGNGRIVFASNRAENLQAEIYAVDVDGTERRNLTRSLGEFDNAPVVSPDGRTILFRRSRDNFQGIWAMDANGDGQRPLVDGALPAWSPDGTRIAFVDSRSRVSVVDVAGGEPRPLVEGTLPAWSPDGASVAFVAGFTVRVVDADGRNARRIAPELVLAGVISHAPAWSPDGTRIAFVGGEPDANGLARSSELYVADVERGSLAQLTTEGGAKSSPAWSPDGRRLVFVQEPLDGGKAELEVVGVDGTGRASLTRSERLTYDGEPAWSPDGHRIAFARGPAPTSLSRVLVVNADGTGLSAVTRESPLTRLPAYEGPEWLPDGGTLVYASLLQDNDYDLFTATSDGTGVRGLTDNAVQDTEPAWSPDGSRIAFVRRNVSGPFGRWTFNEEIYVMHADGSGVRRLTRHGGEDTSPAWSPDGSRLAFVRRTGRAGLDLYTMRAAGGGVRRLTTRSSFFADPAWSPDGRTLLFASADTGNGGPLYALDRSSGRTRRLSPPGATYATPAWSPRGDRIAFVKVTHCGGSCSLTDAWVMNRDGSGARELATGAHHVAWSPDGRLLLIDSGTVEALRADGSGRIRVTPESGAHDATPDWQPRCTRYGTARADRMLGRSDAELLCALGGEDLVRGGAGSDRLFGGDGDDRMEARDGAFDVVGCGAGRDTVVADRRDLVGADCEVVSRR
jgi:TolB protein